jgi:hypothetical protein
VILAAIGSRSFADYTLLCEILDSYMPVSLLISGGAKGADYLAHRWAASREVPVAIYRADWHNNGKQAGLLRNAVIVEKADQVVAFWDGLSRGTADTISRAKKTGKPLQIVPFGYLLKQQAYERRRKEETAARGGGRSRTQTAPRRDG